MEEVLIRDLPKLPDPDELIRMAAVSAAASSFNSVTMTSSIIERAKEFEKYIREGWRY